MMSSGPPFYPRPYLSAPRGTPRGPPARPVTPSHAPRSQPPTVPRPRPRSAGQPLKGHQRPMYPPLAANPGQSAPPRMTPSPRSNVAAPANRSASQFPRSVKHAVDSPQQTPRNAPQTPRTPRPIPQFTPRQPAPFGFAPKKMPPGPQSNGVPIDMTTAPRAAAQDPRKQLDFLL